MIIFFAFGFAFVATFSILGCTRKRGFEDYIRYIPLCIRLSRLDA